MSAFHQWFVVATDEFAYPVRGLRALAQAALAMADDDDGTGACAVRTIDCWEGVSVPTADDWGRIGEGAGCRLCCAQRMDGFDAQGREAFLRLGPSCKGCAA